MVSLRTDDGSTDEVDVSAQRAQRDGFSQGGRLPTLLSRSSVQFQRPRMLTRRIELTVLVALAVAPAILAFIFIFQYGVNVPFFDEWDLVPYFDQLYTGTLSFSYLFRQHNEHRVIFPRLIILGLGQLMAFNVVAEMYVSWLLSCMSGYILYKVCRSNFQDTRIGILAFIPISWLFFSLRQAENLLWGFEITISLCILMTLLAIVLLARSHGLDRYWLGACACGIVSSFSFGTGLLMWPTGALQIVLIKRCRAVRGEKLPVQSLVGWCFVGAAVYAAYFSHYIALPSTSDGMYVLGEPGAAVAYLLAALGSPLTTELIWAQAMGLLLLPLYGSLLYVLLARPSGSIPSTPVFAALATYALLSIALIMKARVALGVDQAMASRYTSITGLGIIALYLFAISRTARTWRMGLTAVLVILISAGTATTYAWAQKIGTDTRTQRAFGAYFVATYPVQGEQTLTSLFPDSAVIKAYAPLLEKYHLSVFSAEPFNPDRLSHAVHPTMFFLDEINSKPIDRANPVVVLDSSKQDTIIFSGWAVDPVARAPAGGAYLVMQEHARLGGVFVTIDDRIHIPAFYGLERPDVAEVLRQPAYRFSGFKIVFGTRALGPGRHTVSFGIIGSNGAASSIVDQQITLDIV